MTKGDANPSVPVQVEALVGFSSECSCGKIHSIDTAYIEVTHGALAHIENIVGEFHKDGTIGLLCDSVTWWVAGQQVEKALGRRWSVQTYIVPDGEGGRPHATFETILNVEQHLSHAAFFIAVGSGTINDLAKLISFRLDTEYIVVPTAPSMNGYTSAIAAVMKDGLKQTVDCHQPIAVVADLDVLVQAPMELFHAGLGDLESKPVSTADFLLSSLLRQSYYCPVPLMVVTAAEAKVAACAHRLPLRDPLAVKELTEALLLSGCSMKLAGSSSPASGGEHLMSHYWDMTAAEEGRVEGFHGTQVGIATIVSASLYAYLRRLQPADIDVEKLISMRSGRDNELRQIEMHHSGFGALAAAQYGEKRLTDAALRKQLVYIISNWDFIWSKLTMLKEPAEIRDVLCRAGAPVTIEAIGLTSRHLRTAFLRAREIRGRFTVLDFAADLGVLESGVDEVIAISECESLIL